MDYEKNNEVLAIVRRMVADGQVSQEVAEKYFPELKESEDERIRKELIAFLKENLETGRADETWSMSGLERWIAWLEKQGEEIIPLKEIILNVWELGNYWKELTKGICNTEHGTQLDYIVKHWKEGEHYIKSFNKQGEQKPVAIPKFRVGDFVKDANYHGEPTYEIVGMDGECYICQYRGNKSMGDRSVMHFCFDNPYLRLVGQKPAWSEYDCMMIESIIQTLEITGDKGANRMKIDFLKSLKSRVQPQPRQEWSEEDKRSIRDSIFYLKSAKKYFEKDDDILWDEKWFNLCIEFLEALYKKLQPQPQWKPSDEQIGALEHFVRSLAESGFASPYDSNTKLVYSLFNDLKKLREE